MAWYDSALDYGSQILDLFGGSDSGGGKGGDGVFGWLQKNADWIEPVAMTGLGAYGIQQKKSNQDDLIKWQENSNQEAYRNANEERDWMSSEMDKRNAIEAKAIADAVAAQKAYYAQAMALLEPYIKIAKELAPKKKQAYEGGLAGLQSTGNALFTPDSVAMATTPPPTDVYNTKTLGSMWR